MKRPVRAGLAVIAGGGLSYIAGSWLGARALADRLISAEGLGPTEARREDLIDALKKSAGLVTDYRYAGSARDPVELAALFASPGKPNNRPTVLFLHGKGGRAAEWMPDALRALRLGYNTLLPDLRGHPPSGGRFFTYGFLEKEDLDRALAAASSRFGVDPNRIGIHSCSAGSTVALEYAAGRPGVRALWLESPYADVHAMARHYLSLATGLPEWLLTLTARWAVRRAVRRVEEDLAGESRGSVFEVDPLRALRSVEASVCLVAGDADRLVPPRFVRRLEAALSGRHQVWHVSAAGHCHHPDEAAKVAAREYERRWTDFFHRHLPLEV